jgi:hypothetical protein
MLVLLLVLGKPALAQDTTQVSEADVKAAFLFGMAKFITWPAEAFASETAPVVVGVYGDELFTRTLQTLVADRKVHGRSITVKRLTKPEDGKTCQILYFGAAETRKMGQVYDSIKRMPILTVGESDDFLDQGGMFNFFFEDKQLRFEVNPPTTENAKLTVSSHLLRLAKKVRKGGAK